jgi:hypothetical protein
VGWRAVFDLLLRGLRFLLGVGQPAGDPSVAVDQAARAGAAEREAQILKDSEAAVQAAQLAGQDAVDRAVLGAARDGSLADRLPDDGFRRD